MSTIAMVTNTVERCMNKCEVYWPDVLNEEKEVEPFIIKLTTQQVFADYTVRYMELKVNFATTSFTSRILYTGVCSLYTRL